MRWAIGAALLGSGNVYVSGMEGYLEIINGQWAN
jgi:hypothetical protein